jgi:cytochrome c biogenesis protein CcmG, thiol:disulfide interchange protein DsbE
MRDERPIDPMEGGIDDQIDDGLEPEPELEPEPAPRPTFRRRGVGPFSLRQVTLAILVVMGTAIVLTLATVPLGTTEPGLPVPDPSAFLIGSPEPGLDVGDQAPELAGVTGDGPVGLLDLNGAPIRLADLRGKAVWINFWASWCPPCQFETPTIRAMQQRYGDRGLVIVAVQVQQTVQAGRDYAATYGLTYTIGADVTGAIFHTYHVFALPTQFFIDSNGILRQIVNGPLSETRATQLIESILPGGASATPSPTH